MKQPIPSIADVGRRTPMLDTAGGVKTSEFFESMASLRTALLATAASALSLAAAPAALANGLSFTNYTTANGLGDNNVRGVYASGSTIYAATDGGLSIAQQSDPTPSAVPGPLPLFGAASAFGFSRKLRRRLRAAASTSC
jgi:hypothetical protein